MTIDSTAFERYRRSPNQKTTFLRLVAGVVIVTALWFATTFGLISALLQGGGQADGDGNPVQQFMGSASGLLATLATFAGIWIGLWIVMRWLHGEKFSCLFGNSARIARGSFLKGFAAVVITSLLTELAYYVMMPEITRGPIGLGAWALLVAPVAFFAFIQTSSEELLFRGYLQRGLAYRFRSPIIWAVLPTVAFTALHWNPQSLLGMNIGVVISIGAFAALLAFLVYVTGNLGAGMGAHLANNLIGFSLISHDNTLGGLALFQAAPLDGLAWTPGETATIATISIVSILLTWLLLLHRRSPLRVTADLGRPEGA
ncbi:MAG: type II CAAX endopeptidase family protein [Hyphomicrobiales bacterium]|nr:type II CAAX endopeptidase family protein [Hyphomicrobiales bacterium]